MKSSGDFCYPFFQATENKGNTKTTGVTMRKKCTDQVSIFDLFSNHDIGKELKAMSERLDRHREILDWVAMDLHLKDVYDTGRQGLPAESVLRCALLKQYRQLSYQELAFHFICRTRPPSRHSPACQGVCFPRSPLYKAPSAAFKPRPGSGSITVCWWMPKTSG